jgi:hypothetical protein
MLLLASTGAAAGCGLPGSGILANPVIERIAHPTVDAAGRRVPAMRFADPRVQALAGCLAVWDFAVSGITNRAFAPG